MLVHLALSVVLLCCFVPELRGASNDPAPQDAVLAVTAAFDRYDLVGLGEAHRNQNVHDFAVSLIRSPGFCQKVNDIVVEFGSGRYQSMVDRYVDGGDVPVRELRSVWRDTVNILVWDAPVYERFFRVVRDVNRRLPKDKRLRVLLGDPAFEWDQVHTNEQWEKIAAQRDAHAAEVIMKEVIEKRHKALLFYGSLHLTRESAYRRFGGKIEPPNLTEMLEQDYAQKVFVIWPEMTGWGEIGASYGRLAGWRAPSLAVVRGTWLGETAVGQPGGGPALQELADAFLYLGPEELLRESVPPAKLYRDGAYLAELQRRDRIQGGFNSDELQQWARRFSRTH